MIKCAEYMGGLFTGNCIHHLWRVFALTLSRLGYCIQNNRHHWWFNRHAHRNWEAGQFLSSHSTEVIGRVWVNKIKNLSRLCFVVKYMPRRNRSSKLIWARIVQSSILMSEVLALLCIFFIVWVVAESFRECANQMGGYQIGFWCCATLLFRTIGIN